MAKFQRLLQGLLAEAGTPLGEAGDFTSYALRRFLPSLADACRLDDTAAQAVGDWQDVAKGAGSKRPRAQHPMARRYAADSSTTAGEIKVELVAALAA
eukprot:6012552-Lingulodinium_polyedra.AAC.1